MTKFRKKPVVIEAEKVSVILKNAKESNCNAQPEWLLKYVDENLIIFGENHLYIKTPEGVMRGDYDDYIIKGVNNEIYPCKPDIFEKTYEPVDESFSSYDLGDVH